MTYNTQSEVITAYWNECQRLNNDLTAIKAEMADKSTTCFYLSRLVRRYMNAKNAAGNFGYIGVGAISFADHRLQEFQRRIGK